MASPASFVQRANLEYIESLYQQFKQQPESVDQSWKMFFEGVEFASDGSFGLSEKELDVYHLITAYRNYGHLEAQLDPLANTPPHSEQLSMARFHLSDADLDKKFQIGKIIGKPNATLREIVSHLRACYCGKLTIQCADALPETREWFIREFEQNAGQFKLNADDKRAILTSLTHAEALEKFIHTRYVGKKRFSVEGGDSLLPMMETMVDVGVVKGAREFMLGMAHRGRVNVLANFMEKNVEQIFADFNGPTELAEPIEDYDGDVKYHMGYTNTRKTKTGECRVSLAFNPSHLEAVNPVVLGMTRAAQRKLQDTEKRKAVIPVLIHGDAAFAGQGIVLETFQMAYVKGYTVGGTLHIAIDNQVGFTTNPENSRSAHYCTDAAKVLQTPVLHVNGDDVEACVRAMDIAVRYRQEWGRDIVVNLVCYRKFGHNEGDEPAYTQPLMYDVIRKHPTVREIYAKKLASEGVVDLATAESILASRLDVLQKHFDNAKANPPKVEAFKFDGNWKGLRKGKPEDFEKAVDTTVPVATLKEIATKMSQVPQGFTPHPKLQKLLETRAKVAEGNEMMDWGTAELLAYGSLLKEGSSVRITGQDCVRGTFTHRHAGLYDVKTGESYFALDHLRDDAHFCVYDSVLSEYGVMGYEYGNAISDPTFLTIWEAQFGDFANTAQVMIDQFIASGESKWQQMCGLVLLLPHGYEGQGPEHSSARLERFLQLCAQHNMTVANMTTPAQIYHALRRQMKRQFRKPLIVMSPKSLLRHPKAVSSMDELAKGTFQEVIGDSFIQDAKKVETLVLCSGKVYYDLHEHREKENIQRTAVARLEQIYPTPKRQLIELVKMYPNLKNFVWAQEEPRNMGAFGHIYFRLNEILMECNPKLTVQYVGRPDRASPAVGSEYRHKKEQAEIIQTVFKI